MTLGYRHISVIRWVGPPAADMRHPLYRVFSSFIAFASSECGVRTSMLPGLRFLFAAIMLSVSLLIFGLGAAALLRAAHEEFASLPSRRPPPETLFAQRDDSEPT